MSNQRQPSETDRAISHTVVSLSVGGLVGRKLGLWGFLGGAAAAYVVHEALDAPLAQVVADITH